MTARFCPACGGALVARALAANEPERQVCERCGRVHYRNAKPAAGALVVRGGRVLLVRRGIAPGLGPWDIPGGFLEVDEHPEAGAIRELREETKLRIRPTEILGIYLERYPYAPHDSGEMVLNIYYLAAAPEGEPRPSDDAAATGWFAPDTLPGADELAFPHCADALADLRRRLSGS
ncbi:MAG: NUDIX hydrolase [Chloroflexota bacterium]|nr:NUDIX hydrolase [Chloroflexota bacterium]